MVAKKDTSILFHFTCVELNIVFKIESLWMMQTESIVKISTLWEIWSPIFIIMGMMYETGDNSVLYISQVGMKNQNLVHFLYICTKLYV